MTPPRVRHPHPHERPRSSWRTDAFLRWGIPASVLTDNAAVFTGLPRRGGRIALEVELGRLGIRFAHSRPHHPQTCGKVERYQQTEKEWLAAQPPARTIAALSRQLSRFRRYTNQARPHRALARRTPGRPTPPDPRPPAPSSTRTAGSATTRSTRPGTVTLRHNSRMHHIGVGRQHAGTRITLLIEDLHIRIVDRLTGELLRELTADPSRDFQPRGVPAGLPKKNTRNATMSRDTCQRCPGTSEG
jgi:hypothetical protein